MQRWIEQLPARLSGRLAKSGILESRRMAAAKRLRGHRAAHKQALPDKSRTKTHARDTYQCVKAILERTKTVFLSDVDGGAVLRCLARRREQGLRFSGSNHYVTAAKSLFNWSVKEERSVENPIRHLD